MYIMKKIIAFLMVITLALLGVCSCNNRPAGPADDGILTEEELFAAVANVAGCTKVVSITKIIEAADIYSGEYVTVKDGDNLQFTYKYQKKNDKDTALETGVTDRIITVEGSVWLKDGKYSVDNGATWTTTAPGVTSNDVKMNIAKDSLKDIKISDDTKSFEAKIAKENASAVFGVEIDADSDVTIKVVTDGSKLRSVNFSYTSSGVGISVGTSYTYDAQTLDFTPAE